MFLQSGGLGKRPRLLRQFLSAAAATIFLSMALLSFFISRQLESSLMQTAAEEGAIVIDILLGPSLQELATSKTLSQPQTEKLDELLKIALGDRTKAVKIWLRDGTLIFATDKQLVGQKFPSLQLDTAFRGSAFGSLTNLGKEENQAERHLELPLIEIYAPIYRSGTREIIAVGEIYNSGLRLQSELKSFRWAAIGVVGAVTAPMMLALLFLVWRASAIVTDQRRELQKRVTEATALSIQNVELRQISEALKDDVFHSNERLLSQIGQDLHDGPVQLVSILALKLSELNYQNHSELDIDKSESELKTNVEDLTAAILRELRDISVGLVLPELDGLSIAETLNFAIDHHEKITGTSVKRTVGPIAFEASAALRVCVFRVVQQGLNNAYFHGKGQEQRLVAYETNQCITITITNRAQFSFENKMRIGGLGLPGLRRRVEALGGSFSTNRTEETMCVKVTFPRH
ncbi:sensor histidine kinase [Tardiphaga sp. 20_F10_N6_6]|uniref:sensor histidine kinase n=1 Tax=Tardiphaga sp. 20_F10_N6_6 TaxID=3240788 RepID=UPI003F89E19B